MTATAVVRCKCSHARTRHSQGSGQCWAGPCGCGSYRPDVRPVHEERCSFSDLPVSGCAHCRGDQGSATGVGDLSSEDVLSRFPAGYNQACDNCGGPIHRGDTIAALTDGSGYACSECLP